MKYSVAFMLCIMAMPFSLMAQVQKDKMTREDKQEKSQARQDRINTKNDYIIFHRQASALKEFMDEKKKIPKLQADSKMPVKVVITIDSLDEGDTATKVMTGYIVQNIGDNATLLYDLTYDRAQKKILSVQKTQEAIDAEKSEKEDKEEKAAERKPGAKPVVHKKSPDDDDDDEPEEKPSKKDRDDD